MTPIERNNLVHTFLVRRGVKHCFRETFHGGKYYFYIATDVPLMDKEKSYLRQIVCQSRVFSFCSIHTVFGRRKPEKPEKTEYLGHGMFHKFKPATADSIWS